MRLSKRLLILVVIGVSGALAVASVPLFILYDDRPLARADAVVVLAGSRARVAVGRELVAAGVAPTLVISDGLRRRSWKPATRRLCRQRDRVLCPSPTPYSTRGEARMIVRLARERGWDSVVVVTSRFHLYRARLLIERCFDGSIGTVGARSSLLWLPYALTLEWGKLARAAVVRGC